MVPIIQPHILGPEIQHLVIVLLREIVRNSHIWVYP